jgi:dUTP pyrophosphatase
MNVKIKKLHPNAVIPQYASIGDAGMDLVITEIEERNEFIEVKFGLAVEIPKGFFGLMCPRSNITKMNLMMKNGIGIIDSGYRGELVCRFKDVKFRNTSDDRRIYNPKHYKIGDRAAQLIILPYPSIEFEEVEELSSTERGEGGFGSTGIN